MLVAILSSERRWCHMNRRSTIGKCPICEARLKVTELSCPACHSRLITELETCAFCNLSPGLYRFLEIFLKSRGNIKEVEKELGISYPTVRKRLDDLLATLGLEARTPQPPGKRSEVFEKLRKGEISVDDAVGELGT
jgi:hypothetical protein